MITTIQTVVHHTKPLIMFKEHMLSGREKTTIAGANEHVLMLTKLPLSLE